MTATGRRIPAGEFSLWVESEGQGRPIVVLHGFTGSGESMSGVAERLRDGYEVHRIDLLGHGRSDAPESAAGYGVERSARQVLAVIDHLGLERPHLIGYSMGGRVALALAVAHPECIASLVLVGATPGLAAAELRAQRVAADEALAARILEHGIERFVDDWMALPLFASQRRLGAEALANARCQRLRNRPAALAASLRGMGTGAMTPLHEALPGLDLPVLAVVGAEDEKFTAIARELVAALSRGQLERLDRAGHAAHLERPDDFARLVRGFFESIDDRLAGAADPSRAPIRPPGCGEAADIQHPTMPRPSPGRERSP